MAIYILRKPEDYFPIRQSLNSGDEARIREEMDRLHKRSQQDTKLRSDFIQNAFDYAATDVNGIGYSIINGTEYIVDLQGRPPCIGDSLQALFHRRGFPLQMPRNFFSENEIEEHDSFQSFLNFLKSERVEVSQVQFDLNHILEESEWHCRRGSVVSFSLNFES